MVYPALTAHHRRGRAPVLQRAVTAMAGAGALIMVALALVYIVVKVSVFLVDTVGVPGWLVATALYGCAYLFAMLFILGLCLNDRRR